MNFLVSIHVNNGRLAAPQVLTVNNFDAAQSLAITLIVAGWDVKLTDEDGGTYTINYGPGYESMTKDERPYNTYDCGHAYPSGDDGRDGCKVCIPCEHNDGHIASFTVTGERYSAETTAKADANLTRRGYYGPVSS